MNVERTVNEGIRQSPETVITAATTPERPPQSGRPDRDPPGGWILGTFAAVSFFVSMSVTCAGIWQLGLRQLVTALHSWF
jgi:hypothetical protein